ncbi:MAG: formylglycine-generating enzyme family protein [bacterium]|nr:formylglycine-generating enzyme family protein [bacterium]
MSRVLLSRLVLLSVFVLILGGCGDESGSPASAPPGTVTISVLIAPENVSANWELSGPGEYYYQGSGDESVTNINSGEYLFTPGDVQGMVTPNPQTAWMDGGETKLFTATYIEQEIAPREITMVAIDGGSFEMGSPESDIYSDTNERPQHMVTISSLLASDAEITEYQFFNIMSDGFEEFSGCADCPVITVTFLNAIQFCNALSVIEGLEPAYDFYGEEIQFFTEANGYRLPTESEWEYLCRAGSETVLTNGDLSVCCDQYDENLDAVAWYGYNAGETVHPVAMKEANAFGLYDVHGNVREWCWDWLADYSADPQTDPTGPETGSYKTVRGGSWNSGANLCRSAKRVGMGPGWSDFETGFRIVRSSN